MEWRCTSWDKIDSPRTTSPESHRGMEQVPQLVMVFLSPECLFHVVLDPLVVVEYGILLEMLAGSVRVADSFLHTSHWYTVENHHQVNHVQSFRLHHLLRNYLLQFGGRHQNLLNKVGD